ncbi:MAG: response regulator, partial [Fimbriimonadaceae bacterium]
MPRVRPARVLIVDESPSMRLVISRALFSDQNLQVVGEAGDPLEASQLIAAVAPDVVTLDIRMPHMGGLEFLSWIMRNRPLPVVMVSRLTTAGAEMTIKALELGAVDWVAKPTPEDPHTFRDLSAKVQRAAQCQLPRQHGRQHASQHRRLASSTRETYQPNGRVAAIGS